MNSKLIRIAKVESVGADGSLTINYGGKQFGVPNVQSGNEANLDAGDHVVVIMAGDMPVILGNAGIIRGESNV